MDAFDKFFAIFTKGDNFCDYLFASMYATPLLKRGLLYKERIFPLRSKFIFYRGCLFLEGDKQFLTIVKFPINV